MDLSTDRQPFLSRLYVYQKERFPLLVHIPLIAAFSFSAIAYSRACRGMNNFLHWKDYLACVCTNIILFFLLRVADEHKDRHEDVLYRAYLPVPRGLITLKELSALAYVLLILATIFNILYYPGLLMLYIIMMGYLLLMRYEFFVPAWLKKKQVLYIVSHMLIIPLADIYASSFDWKLSHSAAPYGLICFFIVSYLNGIVLEIGRKMRVAGSEEPGVVSYTKLWGIYGAALTWLGILTMNFLFACIAAHYARYSQVTYIALSAVYLLSAMPTVLFMIQPSKAKTKWIEFMSLLWAMGMYLILGGIPMLLQLIPVSH